MTMVLTCTVNGASVDIDDRTMTIACVANGTDRLTLDVTSEDGTVRPAERHVIIVVKDGVRLFGGHIDQPDEHGFQGDGLTAITTSVSALSYNALTERRRVTGTLAAGTTKARLTAVLPYLAPYGTTLSPTQADGPTLVERVYMDAPLTQVLKDAKEESGWVGGIDYDNVLSLRDPATLTAPFSITDTGGHVRGDLRIAKSGASYANRVIYRCGPSGVGETPFEHIWTADGVARSWSLEDVNVPASSVWPGVVWVDAGSGYASLPMWSAGMAPGGNGIEWDYATAGGTLSCVGTEPTPAAGTRLKIAYYPQYPFAVQADDEDEQGPGGVNLWEYSEAQPSITTYPAAIASVQAELARRVASALRTAYYATETDGLAVGQTQTITSAIRHVDASFLINELRIRDAGDALNYSVTAVEGSRVQPTFRDASSGGASASGTGVVVSGGSSSTASASPFSFGGSRSQPLELGLADWWAVPEWDRFEAPQDGTVRVKADLWAMVAEGVMYARIYCLTDSAAVGDVQTVVPTTEPTPYVWSVAVEATKDYCLQIKADGPSRAIFAKGEGRYL